MTATVQQVATIIEIRQKMNRSIEKTKTTTKKKSILRSMA